jgi:hypothetical protein
MQFTPRRAIGGRAWTSLLMETTDQEKALVLWSNTTLGLMMYWWHANKQQSGRGSIGVSALETLPVFDVRELSTKQLAQAVKVFDELSGLNLLPMHQIDTDPVRRQIDERFGREVLDLSAALFGPEGAFDLLRRKLASEPSIRGNKAG